MRYHILTAAAAVAILLPGANATAQTASLPGSVKVERVERSENNMIVSFTLDFTDLKLKSNRQITYIPYIAAADSVKVLPKVVVAGRNRYIQNQRKRLIPAGDILTRPGSVVDYQVVVPYRVWMEKSQLMIQQDECGCGYTRLSESTNVLTDIDLTPKTFSPQWAYSVPAVEARKERNSSGSAYIDFRINRTEIDPDYRRNPTELASIRDTIDMVKNDPDSRIDAVSIRGFASPDGPYDNNERLAKGRTASLAQYVRGLYSFPDSVMECSWVAENWEGLAAYVKNSTLADRDEILALINDTSVWPDERDARLRRLYPEQYTFLLENVYPGLRRCDYEVHYTVAAFTDPARIAQVLAENPRKLSLHELYLLAQTLPSDSDGFREVFEVAVRLFPDDPVANLNAAFTAMRFGDLDNASRYLAKAGDSPEAIYARGIYAAKTADYVTAAKLLQQASGLGLTSQAGDALAQLREMGYID